MSQLTHANSFNDLIVYQKSRKLAQDIFVLTKKLPKEEMFSLTDQIRRSSRSIGAQISEGWAKRRYEKHFVSKLTDADGEQFETQHWLKICADCGYITQQEVDILLQQCSEIGRLLGGVIAKSHLFCKPESLSVSEEQAEYLIVSDHQN